MLPGCHHIADFRLLLQIPSYANLLLAIPNLSDFEDARFCTIPHTAQSVRCSDAAARRDW
jgi:hypothetical protein